MALSAGGYLNCLPGTHSHLYMCMTYTCFGYCQSSKAQRKVCMLCTTRSHDLFVHSLMPVCSLDHVVFLQMRACLGLQLCAARSGCVYVVHVLLPAGAVSMCRALGPSSRRLLLHPLQTQHGMDLSLRTCFGMTTASCLRPTFQLCSAVRSATLDARTLHGHFMLSSAGTSVPRCSAGSRAGIA